MQPCTYILRCQGGGYYTGSTIDIRRRLEQHFKELGANFTRKNKPEELVYIEFYDRIGDAFRREKQIQGWSRRKKEALIHGELNKLHELAKCRNETNHLFSKGIKGAGG